ncbi:serine/threonine protein kinase [Paenibacillus sp. NEAU-GSW1]|uniref:serine/threonine protein kinase n=1 Tax=Paenibacillus sp. NEAU-GSW1 TaxID=2682486 RepID=UPI0012E26D03|nr:serine/threonine protein kinase [Paenibacillus sp. NEAU-GSW1]MUT67441.1 serine/threonine protein kinase [Paenibacillus sp. NEAU-GSW1]
MNQQPVLIKLDSVEFKLQGQHDFSWLQSLGKVFCVFDQQDSGNICFGIEKGGKKLFVKYAGCKPMDFSGNPRDAILRLSTAIPLYTTLEHPYLIKLVDHFETENGYAAIFEWFNGECLHSHWLFVGEAFKHTHPDSPFYKYKQLTVERRLHSLDAIYEFHRYVESKGYIAVDFYDGSILYDFSQDITKICDIDFYREAPSVNDIGEKFWGARRSKSPEEFTLGAPIDSKTNVFTMGAIAFGLLGGEMDQSYSKWEANRSLYEVALRAISKEREKRYNNINEFKKAWDTAKIE